MILIDMHMPKNCIECPIHDGEYGWCDLDADIAMNCDDRPDNCPLHEVTDPDTVSRQVVLDAVEKCHTQCCRQDSTGDEWVHYDTIRNEMECLPPSPSRPHGQWIRHHEITDGNDIIKGYMCNQCKRVVEVHSWETLNEKYPFCHCGADMRGGKA